MGGGTGQLWQKETQEGNEAMEGENRDEEKQKKEADGKRTRDRRGAWARTKEGRWGGR